MISRFRDESALLQDVGVALGVVSLLALTGGAVIYGVIPELRGWALGLLWASLVGFAGFAVLARGLIAGFVTTRQGRYGVNTLVMVIAFVAILILVNFLSTSVNFRNDLTATNRFSLEQQTLTILDDLTEPIETFAFFTFDDPAADVAESLLREYAHRSDKFSYRFVDPETEPATASRFQIDQNGVIVFSSADRVTRTVDLSEQSFTATLLRATGFGLKTVCFLTGHGERSIVGSTEYGLNVARVALERELYIVRDFGLQTSGGVPEECATVVIVGANRDIDDEESVLLRQYLGGGGNALLALGNDAPDSWTSILRAIGIVAGVGTVVDPASFARPDPATPVIRQEDYNPNHPITVPLVERSVSTFFPVTTQMAPAPAEDQVPGALVVPLIRTSQRSWLDTDLIDPSTASFDQTTDLFGPIWIATVAELPTVDGVSRIVALGSSDFVGNQAIGQLGNGDLFINAINWATGQESLITIRPKLSAPRIFIISQRQWSWILYSSVGVLPALVSLVGAWTWWRRR
jgi:ABC-type uncharacterized transport system involved in gliding motility auxiliary subunit